MSIRIVRYLWAALIALLLVRLITLGLYPLMGTTEPRYAEIARKVLSTGDWVTPWYDHGVPFWGKPPLSFWGSAVTMAVFGINEFAARLGPYLATVACVALLWAWPVAQPGGSDAKRVLAPAAALVALSSLAGYISAGAVMTDMFMTLGTTLCMVAFWISVGDSPNAPAAPGVARWRWLFFVGIAIGLLAKGPVATVLTGIALALWLLAGALSAEGLRARCLRVWRNLPWLRGSLLVAVLTLPWYLLAEQRTPGFLNYFIVGEHIQRFLVSGWTGDLYGQGHAEPRGTIFWFAFLGWLPWSVVVPLMLALAWWWRSTGVLRRSPVASNGELQYLLAWVLASLLFFAISRNILPSYILPGLPAFGLLVAMLGIWLASARPAVWWLWLASAAIPAAVCALLVVNPGFMDDRSQRGLLKQWTLGTPLIYLEGRPLSADFYSRGQAVLADKPADVERWLAGPGVKDGQPISLVMERFVYERQPPERLRGWRIAAEHGGFVLLRKP